MAALRSVIDPADLRWIWLTHTDFDHIGALPQLLAENPTAPGSHHLPQRGHHEPVRPAAAAPSPPPQPRAELTVGDRTLTAVKPPVFDNPATTGFHDDKSGALFSSDCFGALLQAAPETRPSSLTRSCGRVRSSGRPWIPLAPQGRRCRLGQGTERHPRHGSALVLSTISRPPQAA